MANCRRPVEQVLQTHLKLDVFLYAEAYKNRSFTAFDAREAYWNRRTRRYMYTPSTGRVHVTSKCCMSTPIEEVPYSAVTILFTYCDKNVKIVLIQIHENIYLHPVSSTAKKEGLDERSEKDCT